MKSVETVAFSCQAGDVLVQEVGGGIVVLVHLVADCVDVHRCHHINLVVDIEKL